MMKDTKTGNAIVILFVTIFSIVVIRNAWLSDDIFITMRTVDNSVNGFRLTWNTGERVQVYTHPLWMFLITSVYSFTREPYFSLIFTSLVVSIAVVVVLSTKIAQRPVDAIFGIIMLTFSQAFVDYSTSGLENPLTHLLLVVFWFIYLKREHNSQTLFFLALIAAFAAVNRLDAILLYLPALIHVVFSLRTRRAFLFAILGFLPLILWELFSLFYYGFLFPNTAYSKLGTGIASAGLLQQGLLYMLDSLERDPFTLIIVITGILLAIFTRESRIRSIALGMLLYLIYVIKIGGDFMSGRFFSAILLCGVILLMQEQSLLKRPNRVCALIAIVILGLMSKTSPVYSNFDDEIDITMRNGIVDERRVYVQGTNMRSVMKLRNSVLLPTSWAQKGWAARKKANRSGSFVIEMANHGYYSYFAGPKVHIIDKYGLGDPLLARLPVQDTVNWRIGHFERSVPDGYFDTIASGENMIEDPNLRVYYDKLSLIISGDLFKWERLVEIIKFNLGYYDPMLNAYINSLR